MLCTCNSYWYIPSLYPFSSLYIREVSSKGPQVHKELGGVVAATKYMQCVPYITTQYTYIMYRTYLQ